MSQTGYDYAPKGKPRPVCEPGDFLFAAVALDHGHINGQCNGLFEAGGELRWVFDPDPLKVRSLSEKFSASSSGPVVNPGPGRSEGAIWSQRLLSRRKEGLSARRS